MKSLRRRLFTSHLQVMFVALAVLFVGGLVVFGLLDLVGEKHFFGRGSRDDNGPFAALVGLAAAVVASALVSWRVTERLAKPLGDIGAATQALASGRYDVRLPGADTVELDALATDVNQLAHELETTEARRLRLIGDVAHELRNPLSTIEGTMEALLDGVMPAEPDTFARIGREAARLRRLADDLSSLSAAGEFTVDEHLPVDIAVLVTDVVAQLAPQAAAKGLELRSEGLESITVLGDRDRLAQVITNIVGNAVQYTDAGHITVSTPHADGWITIEVADTGRGLAPADETRIFERFHRVDEQLSDGTGVGLAIAKLITESHDGRISARSDGLGQGTVVRISLPVAAPT